ncbi:MAG: hypothetical protein ACXWE8_05680 [Solirubrobacterales bacterium]
MDLESSSIAPRGRRARTILAALAIAGLSAGFTACDDEDVDNAQEQVDSVQSEVNEAQDSVQSQIDEADVKSQADEIQEDVQSIGEEAQDDINSQIDKAQQGN